ncbi:MAG: UDP-N-acetylmuramoyl-L-alanine--D-glutamate ligase [Ancalomicrobiaceae bacterium]|nr:UDP-N-acetylmuramoyl-L-alanine--D-glutamate ligase [Ancalomicrobiaceae bacterium]
MIAVTTARGRKVAVFGLGGSGLATAEALIAGGADVVAFDDSEASRQQAAEKGVAIVDLHGIDWDEIDMLVLAPGVPLTHPEPHWSVKLASAKGVPVVGDIELLAEEIRATAPTAPLVAITGTNGKSTTTALIAHLLVSAGRDVQLGGNIGRAVLSLDPPVPTRTYVIECSSFQIDLAPTLDPTVGVLLNLSPDHLDRHGTMEAYAAIKERLVTASRTAVVGVDDALSRAIADRLEKRGGKLVRISAKEMLAEGYYYAGGTVWSGSEVAADLAGIGSLRGTHNGQNAAAAIAAVSALGLSREAITAGLKTFPGLAHRMEEVGSLGRILFINDSKATNADSTAQALATFTDIHWILGGKPKIGGIASLAGFFPRVAKAYLIGQASDEFAATLDGQVAYERCGTIEAALGRATEEASASAADEPVVLLSPACASYDQFKNFEVRGDRFRELVAAIPGVHPRVVPAQG